MEAIGIGYEEAFGVWMVVVRGGAGAGVHDFRAQLWRAHRTNR